MPGHDSLAVANYFIDKAASEGGSVTPMKLLKMVYIAHGWSLALRGEPLISDAVEAWQYGPVVPRVYHAFKKFGRHQVESRALKRNADAVFFPEDVDDEPISSAFDSKERGLMDAVWDTYKKFDGLELSQLTHLPDTPWARVYRSDLRSVSIDNKIIAEYYAKLGDGHQAATG